MKLYEPVDVLKLVDRDLWIVDGPTVTLTSSGFSMPFPTRMVVARLADGGLWIWSPVELSSELRRQLDALGPVRHIVSPNKIHYVHVAAWKAAYPDAIAWASPGVRERAESMHAQVAFDRDLVDTPDAAWAGEVDQLVFRGSCVMEEVVFFHRASRTLVLADLIENFERDKLSFSERLLTRLGGVWDPDGKAPTDLRLTFLGHRDVARAHLEKMMAWDPQRIVIAHGRWYDRDGAAELRRAFRWLAA
jgi:hypothetical protein